MSWRRGELWLDTDLLWFRERAGVPALAGFAPPALRLPAPPRARRLAPAPGGLASPPLRAAGPCERRSCCRRPCSSRWPPFATAAATGRGRVGGPAEPDVLAHHREGRGARQARSLGATHSERRRRPPRGVRRRRACTDGRARGPVPAIDWHHATSVGLPYDGSLIDGTQLPVDGPDWVTWDPVTDSVPNEPNRLYGNEHTIRTILSVIAAYRAANPARRASSSATSASRAAGR